MTQNAVYVGPVERKYIVEMAVYAISALLLLYSIKTFLSGGDFEAAKRVALACFVIFELSAMGRMLSSMGGGE